MSVKINQGLVAIVDDDASMRAAIEDLLSSVGLKAKSFESAEDFLSSGLKDQTACLICDIRMPGMSGLELQTKLVAEGSRVPIIFVTAHGNSRMRTQAFSCGAIEFLGKPFEDEKLLGSVRAALQT
jgi:FixJ family two-component response regulator